MARATPALMALDDCTYGERKWAISLRHGASRLRVTSNTMLGTLEG
jgi:hypothetical protein